jgi:hypothetical protein
VITKRWFLLNIGFFLVLFPHLLCVSGTSEYFNFPRPTGRFAIGTKIFYETDYARIDSETGRSRQLVMQIWYPREGKLDGPTSHYAYEALKVLKADLVESGCDAKVIGEQLELIRTHAVFDAQLSHEGSLYPVIIFGHGYGTPRGLYSALCEELSSQGYVVCMVMHTYASGLTRFSDGTESDYMRERGSELVSDVLLMLNVCLIGYKLGLLGN